MAAPPQYGLRLAAVRVQDYKSLRDITVTFGPATTVLLGENNSGKTSLLEALDVAFGRRHPRLEDLHDGPGGKASQLVIDVRIEATDGQDFPQAVIDVVGEAVQLDTPDYFTLRTVGAISAEGWDITLSRSFMKGWATDRAAGDALTKIDRPAVGRDALSLLHFDMLDARRDIVEQLRNKRTYWGRTTSNISIDEQVRSNLETSLRDLGQEVTTKSPVLTQVKQDLSALSDGLSSGNLSVELEALPRRVDDLIRAMDIVITSANSSAFPIESHGMGTRSLAALLVFRSYVNVIRARQKPDRLLSVAAFEEPEAHLHPQSQRAVFQVLSQIGGQRIISTHSAHVASIADLDAYRVFRRAGAETKVSIVTPEALASWSTEQVRRYAQLQNPEVLFAKAVGIFEGQTEDAAFPVFARAWWGERGADAKGVSLVYTAGAGNSKHLVPFLEALGIPWVLFCDGDGEAVKGLEATAKLLGRDLDSSSPEVVMLPAGQAFEDYLVGAGYLTQLCLAIDRHEDGPLSEYMTLLQGQPRKKNAGPRDYTGPDGQKIGCLDFLKGHKGTMGALLAEELVKPVGTPPAVKLPPLVVEFFTRLDEALS